MAHLQDPYPDIELAAPPLAHPIHEPKQIYSTQSEKGDTDSQISDHSASRVGGRRKRESYNLSGSTFLITASGKTLKLPIPSDSELDPLNWDRWKSTGALFAVAWYFVAASTVVQAPSVILQGVAVEFGSQVGSVSQTWGDCTETLIL